MNNQIDQNPADNGPQRTDLALRRLRITMSDIDRLSQSAFSEIRSIARLALFLLETPKGYQHLDDIANVLNAIWLRAEDTENMINAMAEGLGCNYVDEARGRRLDVQAEARGRDGG